MALLIVLEPHVFPLLTKIRPCRCTEMPQIDEHVRQRHQRGSWDVNRGSPRAPAFVGRSSHARLDEGQV